MTWRVERHRDVTYLTNGTLWQTMPSEAAAVIVARCYTELEAIGVTLERDHGIGPVAGTWVTYERQR